MSVVWVMCCSAGAGRTGCFVVYAVICYINAPRGFEWNCRLVTLLHGILIVLLTAYIAFIDGPWPFTHAGEIPKALNILTLHVLLHTQKNAHVNKTIKDKDACVEYIYNTEIQCIVIYRHIYCSEYNVCWVLIFEVFGHV